jgi:hypothetical protein
MGAGMIPAPDKQGNDMTDLNELNLDELNSVTGGVDKPKNPKPPATPGHFEIDDFSFDV